MVSEKTIYFAYPFPFIMLRESKATITTEVHDLFFLLFFFSFFCRFTIA